MIFHDYSILHVFDLSLFTLEGVWYGREMGEFSSITRVSVLPCGRNRRSWLDGRTWTRWYRDPQTATRVQLHWLLLLQILQLVKVYSTVDLIFLFVQEQGKKRRSPQPRSPSKWPTPPTQWPTPPTQWPAPPTPTPPIQWPYCTGLL